MAQVHNPPTFFEMPMPASIRKSLAAGEITPELFALLREAQNLLESGQPEAAVEQLMQAFALSGENPFTLRVIGASMYSLNLYHEALSIYLRLQEIEPNELDVLHSIATLLFALREFGPAMEMMRGLLEQYPGEAPFWLTAGLIACEAGQWDEGRQFFEMSRDIDSSDVTVHMNLGWLHRMAGDLDAAVAEYEIAAELSPDSLSSRYNQALVLLARGDYLRGWETYEIRTRRGSHAYVHRDLSVPLWDGKRFDGERVLIAAEQGLGDQLHFLPDLGTLLEDLKDPVLEVGAKLVPLFQRAFPKLEVRAQMFRTGGGAMHVAYPWIEESGRQFDRVINLGSVPLYVGRTRGAWPARGKGYLTADPSRAKEFGERLKPFGERPRVGVIWHSQFFDGKRANAYAPTEMYGPLLRNFGDVTLVSLQYSHASEGIARLREISGVEVHDFPDLDQFMDVDGVAALIANLDFVVGAKTAPVMLAAALGIPALAIVGGTPWAKPAADGHDPWLPALREVAGGLDWLGLFAKTERISLEWLDALAAGKSLVHPRPAFS